MFCERCGRNLKDDEYVCPECGRQCRTPPMQDMQFAQNNPYGQPQPFNPVAMFSGKYFISALLIGFAAGLAITYFWRFTILMFCVPLFFPMGYKGVGMGLMMGLGVGCVSAMLLKAFTGTAA